MWYFLYLFIIVVAKCRNKAPRILFVELEQLPVYLKNCLFDQIQNLVHFLLMQSLQNQWYYDRHRQEIRPNPPPIPLVALPLTKVCQFCRVKSPKSNSISCRCNRNKINYIIFITDMELDPYSLHILTFLFHFHDMNVHFFCFATVISPKSAAFPVDEIVTKSISLI